MLAITDSLWLNVVMDSDQQIEAWYQRRHYTVDLAGLDDHERLQGSMLIGGDMVEFVQLGGEFDYDQVRGVIFRWGDKRAELVFAALLEHDESPSPEYFPFNASTVVEDILWSLAIQEKNFDPLIDFLSEDQYTVLPFDDEKGMVAMHEHLSKPTPRRELLGKVGPRWVAFEVGTKIKNL